MQNRDGGLPVTPGDESSVSITGWAMLGLEGSGRNPLDLRKAGNSPVSFLRSTAESIRSTGDLERTILALDAAGVSPRAFAGRDLVAELNGRRGANGSFQGQVNLTAFGILALRAAGTPRSSLRRPAEWLRRAANRDGGWGFQSDSQSESDSTGAALQGLAAAGNRGHVLDRGAAYLRRTQRGDGGWSLAFSGPTNAQSTAWAVQGLIAAGGSADVAEGRAQPVRLPRRPPGLGRPLPILGSERSDPGLGHRPGARRGRPRALPALPRAASARARRRSAPRVEWRWVDRRGRRCRRRRRSR